MTSCDAAVSDGSVLDFCGLGIDSSMDRCTFGPSMYGSIYASCMMDLNWLRASESNWQMMCSEPLHIRPCFEQ